MCRSCCGRDEGRGDAGDWTAGGIGHWDRSGRVRSQCLRPKTEKRCYRRSRERGSRPPARGGSQAAAARHHQPSARVSSGGRRVQTGCARKGQVHTLGGAISKLSGGNDDAGAATGEAGLAALLKRPPLKSSGADRCHGQRTPETSALIRRDAGERHLGTSRGAIPAAPQRSMPEPPRRQGAGLMRSATEGQCGPAGESGRNAERSS